MSHPNHSFDKPLTMGEHIAHAKASSRFNDFQYEDSFQSQFDQNYQSYKGFSDGHPNQSLFHNCEEANYFDQFSNQVTSSNKCDYSNQWRSNFDYSNHSNQWTPNHLDQASNQFNSSNQIDFSNKWESIYNHSNSNHSNQWTPDPSNFWEPNSNQIGISNHFNHGDQFSYQPWTTYQSN